ncbi:MAG: valine--tRNA ligase [Dehalococcoidales bacterium]|nr:valine--tRNA ligase [Dehalococcoidales bacterium]
MTEQPKTQSEMPKAYEPAKVEEKWYKFWLEKGYFTPKIDPAKKPFVIIMPPPNITGELHLGHALTATLEDIMVRWHRMQGDPTLWLPGVDHASIAAQVVVERQLVKEGLTRQKLGREKFEQRVRQWADSMRATIRLQHQRLGASCDWTRERYTLDEGPSRAVRTVFVHLYDKGLIYRGERIINWCPRCGTALSDLEVIHQDVQGSLWYVNYPIAGEDGFITVATTRPETILGDTAVAVNPNDERFKSLVGKQVILPAVKRVIPIIADEAIDIAFGTGAVKVTPAHDPVDFDIAQRHKLPFINILNSDATMNDNAGPYAGMERFACRKAIVADLEKEGLLVKIEPYSHAIAHCQRCNTIVEPLASKQWFVKMASLAQPAIDAVTSGRITIIPERFSKVYLNWMENIRDWCISRQLWWGHRIPVWYCRDCNEMIVSVQTPTNCKCGSKNIEQDPDVLDTWFSSGLWPHSTLGWPDKTEDLKYFYPTTVMETGYDIIFFWVARMITMGLEDMGEIPFRYVYLHGLIRDEKGEKMSKTKGNVLNPLELMDKYGTDALRFAVLSGTSPGNDSKLSLNKLEDGQNFANKLYNATKFVLRCIETAGPQTSSSVKDLPVEDRWILSRLHRNIAAVNDMMVNFQFAEAERAIYDFLWGDYCDWYIELSKIRSRSPDAVSPVPVLVSVLETALRLLHPFMPFVTEELWQNLKNSLPVDNKPESIMIAAYPIADKTYFDSEAERIISSLIDIIHSIRNARAEHKVEMNRWVESHIFLPNLSQAVRPYQEAIQVLGRTKPVVFLNNRPERKDDNTLVIVLQESEIFIPMSSMVDLAAERQRLEKEVASGEAEATRLEIRLGDTAFLSKAPAQVVEKERRKLANIQDRLARLKEQLIKL